MGKLRFGSLLLTVSAAAALFTAAGSVESAFADTIDGSTTQTPIVTPGIAGNPDPAVAEITTEDTAIDSTDSAGHPCRTRTFERDLVQWPFGWPTLAWFKMRTYWCWNGSIVTTHTTNVTGGTTGSGAASGWDYGGVVSGSNGWHCYVANGGSRPCSGNTEYAEGGFTECLAKCIGSWYPFSQQWENYHGGYFHN